MNGAERRERSLRSGLCDGRSAMEEIFARRKARLMELRARRKGEDFELDLVLRNNITTAEYPLGVYHPHQELHHIKKENIGLIEVMGLAILPSRLKDQSAAICRILTGEEPDTSREAGSPLAVHADWIGQLVKTYGTAMAPEAAEEAVRKEIGLVFSHVLENAGVFKSDEAGQAAFLKFAKAAGLEEI